jgi:hypothetical protein
VQEAACGTLLRERQRDLHCRVAEAIERLHPDVSRFGRVLRPRRVNL